ncbi:MAG: hypothetical protein AB8H80_20640 [Planctomycetota bacterium]
MNPSVERLSLSHTFPLQRGSHATRDEGMCAMEMVAWLGGEEHSDEPVCACPVLAALVRASNDGMTIAERHRHLRPLVPLLVGSRRTAAVERARGMAAIDWLVRQHMPRVLQRQSGSRHGSAWLLLARLPPILRRQDLTAARRILAPLSGEHRAALWVLDRAFDDLPAPHWVAGVVQAALAGAGAGVAAGAAAAAAKSEVWPQLVGLCTRLARWDAGGAKGGAAAHREDRRAFAARLSSR